MYYLLGLFMLLMVASFFCLNHLMLSRAKKISVFLVLGVVTFLAYFSLGTGKQYWYAIHHPQLVQFFYALEKPALPLPEYKLLADQAARELGRTAEDVPGWLLLSQYYLSIQDLHAASFALESAYEGDPLDKKIATQFVQVNFAANNGMFTVYAKKVLKKLAQDNTNLQARLMMAMLLSQEQQYAKALDLWEQMRKEVPPNSMEAQLIDRGIASLRAKINP